MLRLVSLAALFLISASFASAEEGVVFVDGAGNLYKVSSGILGTKVVPTDASVLSSPEFSRPAGEIRSANGEVRITGNGKVEFRDLGSRSWIDSGLNAPPQGMSYVKGHRDPGGNLFIELGGRGSGFNFVGHGGRPIIPWNKFQWNGSPPPVFAEMVANPYGNGLLARASDGSLWKVLPPTQAGGTFSTAKLADAGSLSHLSLGEMGGKVQAIGSRPGGEIGILTSDNGPLGKIVKELAVPRDASGALSVTSSFDSGSGEMVRAKIQHLAQAKSAPHAPEPTKKSPSGATFELDAEGNLLKLGPDKKPIPGPASVIAPLANDKIFAPFLKGTEKVLTDDHARDVHFERNITIFGREKETADVLDTLIRQKGKNPVLVGEPGVGKTAIAELIVQQLSNAKIPEAAEYQTVLKNAIVVQTTPGRISRLALSDGPAAQASAIEDYIASLQAAEKKLGRRIILYVDEMHMFTPEQLEALKTTLDSRDGILFMGSTTHGEYTPMIGRNGALERRFQPVPVREFTIDETRELLKKSVVPVLEKIYRAADGTPGKIDDAAVDAAIRRSVEYLPNSHRPEGPFKLLQDAMIRMHRLAGKKAPTLTDKDIGHFVTERLGLTLDPTDPKAFYEGVEKLRNVMRDKVVDQERVTDTMVNLWRDINLATGKKKHRVMLIAGPTGAGKTFSAQTFAKEALGDETRVLEIDSNAYATGGVANNDALGAPNGVVSSDKTKGEILDFLDGRGKGANVIVINELDKANPDFAQAIMELLDTGKITRHGKTYYLGKSIIVLTTNKGDDKIYPRGTGKALTRNEIEARMAKLKDKDIRQFFMEPDPHNLYDNSKRLPPSVLNRIDVAVPAAPPSHEGALKIAHQTADAMTATELAEARITLQLDQSAIKHLVDSKYIPEDGVRDLNRAVDKTFNDARQVAFKELGMSSGDSFIVKFEQGQFAISKQGSSAIARFDAPEAPKRFANPLTDPSARAKLASLESRLDQHVIGQGDASRMASTAIRTRAINATIKQPATLLFLGTTGTGKTELGKALAKEVYGHEGRFVAFDMGSVKWEGDMANIFGAAQGIAGSNQMSAFEQFLNDFPEGGVVVFDEIGNMGGGSTHHEGSAGGANSKNDLLKRFYSMIDEGKWRNAHGKVYDLSKYTFVFTSNEGQELFENLPSDDLRIATWKSAKGRENLNQLLKKHGWPEALIGRFKGNIALFKPLVAKERVEIARKMIKSATEALVEQHGIQALTVDDKFYSTIGGSFFSHSEGARAMKALSEDALTDLVGEALFDNYDPEFLKNATFHLSLKDSFEDKLRYKGKTPPERQVLLSLTVKHPRGEKSYTRDIADKAVEKRLASTRDLLQTAYHEAGHAVANDPVLTGQAVDYVTIKGQGGYGGYARYRDVAHRGTLNREQAVAQIGKMLAGGLAQKMSGGSFDSGWSSDIDNARKLAADAVGKYGLSEGTLSLPVREGKVDLSSHAAQKEISALLADGEAFARAKLKENWPAVRLLTEKLLKSGELEGKEFQKIVDYAHSSEYLSKVRNKAKLTPRTERAPGGAALSPSAACIKGMLK